jgi:NADPH2:quinone reductase
LQSGETVLIQGGSSGIGVAAIQLAKYRGANGDRDGWQRDSKCESCLALGADFAINYKAVDFQDRIDAV